MPLAAPPAYVGSATPTILALAAAAALAIGYALTKRLVLMHPPSQLIGVLFAMNALMVAPAAAFVDWRWSWRIVGLHLASAALMIVTAWAVFHLLPRGSAAAVSTGQAISPLPAVLFSALLLPGVVSGLQIAVAVAVVGALLTTIAGSFEALTRARAGGVLLLVAGGHGLLAVLTKLLADDGLEFVPIYLVRTAVAALVWLVLAPPRDLPAASLPSLFVRATFVTASFACSILAIERGSPVTVQTFAATTPLLLVAAGAAWHRRRPPARILVAALIVLGGVLASVLLI